MAAALVVGLTVLQQPQANAGTGHEPLTAAGLVAALTADGVAVPNPIDTTAQECPAAGCEQSIVTDTLRVKSFATVRQAKWYSVAAGLPRFANIVVEFAPPLTVGERDVYLEAIGRLLP
ncbi:hypothetical protein BST42_20470 [Mycolicibacterium rhodesiae]|uniref:Uncharacterized protein n=2 Tax=Mycolicibacterium rhodesiae TaxID=36814 RepID=A0A1X0IP54_MYCRH|nr:hypothetical protein BST42_20470 [Mycolicibacterium rhodesiae]